MPVAERIVLVEGPGRPHRAERRSVDISGIDALLIAIWRLHGSGKPAARFRSTLADDSLVAVAEAEEKVIEERLLWSRFLTLASVMSEGIEPVPFLSSAL